MLHSSFKNYDEFKELFVAKNSNGTTRRKNGVLLAFLKSKAMRERFDISKVTTMNQMFNLVDDAVWQDGRSEFFHSGKRYYAIRLMDGREYASNIYETDGHEGICIDGDISAYRYVNKERDNRVYKMKVGKMYRHLMDILDFGQSVPESVKLWMCEEITRRWEAYAQSRMPSSEVELHVDDNFKGIYSNSDCNDADFHSCMQDDYDEHWRFYENAVSAKAAYLTEGGEIDDGGYIVARCVIFTDVERGDTGEVIRVAERQYSAEGDEVLQRLLIQKLLDGGYIDAYKKTGAGCGDARAFVDKDGNDMSNVKLSIRCTLSRGDDLAYQDSFKWYDINRNKAYNYSRSDCFDLASTDDYFEAGCYSEYNAEYIPEDDAYYVETREDYFWDSQVRYAYVWNSYSCRFNQESCFEGDCLYIDGDYYYAGEDCEDYAENGIGCCPRCGEYFILEDACYSELTEEEYCCEDCMERSEREYKKENWYYSEVTDEYYETESEMEEAEKEYKEEHWHYSEYDDDYYEYEDDVVEWASGFTKEHGFVIETISTDSLDDLLKVMKAVRDEHSGRYYAKEALDEAIADGVFVAA